jgi:hypothetical protein
MNKSAILFAGIVTALAGCEPGNEKVPKASQPGNPHLDASVSSSSATNDRAAAQEKLSATLKDLDGKMAELKERARTAGDQAKAEWEARLPQLEAQRDAAARKLDELKESGKETWETTKTKTEAAFAELERGFKDAWARLKE